MRNGIFLIFEVWFWFGWRLFCSVHSLVLVVMAGCCGFRCLVYVVYTCSSFFAFVICDVFLGATRVTFISKISKIYNIFHTFIPYINLQYYLYCPYCPLPYNINLNYCKINCIIPYFVDSLDICLLFLHCSILAQTRGCCPVRRCPATVQAPRQNRPARKHEAYSLFRKMWYSYMKMKTLLPSAVCKSLPTLSLQAGLRSHLARGILFQWSQSSLNTLLTSRFEIAPCTWNPFSMVPMPSQHSPYKQVWERTLHVECFFNDSKPVWTPSLQAGLRTHLEDGMVFHWSQSSLNTLLTSRFENAPDTWNAFSMVPNLSEHLPYKQVWERTLHVESFFNGLNPLSTLSLQAGLGTHLARGILFQWSQSSLNTLLASRFENTPCTTWNLFSMVSILSQHSPYKQVWDRTLHVESFFNGLNPFSTLSLQAGLRTHLAHGMLFQWFQTSLNTFLTSRFENAPWRWNGFSMVSILSQHPPYKQVWERTYTWNPFSMVSILSQHSLYKQVWERTLHVESFFNGLNPLSTLSLQAGLRTHLARGILFQWSQSSLNTLLASRFENAPCTWNLFSMVSILSQHSLYKQVWERTLHVESFFNDLNPL